MKITLGYFVSGKAYIPLPSSGARAGEMVCGGSALLGMLETMYGLPVAEKPRLVRVAQYERALADSDNGKRFYSKSFSVDSLGAAFQLLGKRDELLMGAGSEFDLKNLKGLTGILADIVEVEKKAAVMAPGMPDRLRAVIGEIKKNIIHCSITKIEFIEPQTSWETLWQELFKTLEQHGCLIEHKKMETTVSTGDLGVAKKLFGKVSDEKKKTKGDGSLLLVDAINISEAADCAALCIRNLLKSKKRVAIITEGASEEAHSAMRRFDLPSPGCTIESCGRDVLQIVPLFLQLLYAPSDPWKMQQYLSLSISPLPRSFCNALSNVVADTGGTGGKKWKTAIDDYLASISGKGVEDIKKRIAFWLRPGTIPAGQGLKSDDLIKVCEEFRTWALKRMHSDEDAGQSLGFAIQQVETLTLVAETRKRPLWSRADLVRILSDITESLPSVQVYKKESGGAEGVFHPGVVLSPVDIVLWWNAGESSVPSLPPHFWSNKNLKQLEENKVRLQPVSEILDLKHAAWSRAAGMAKERLLLFFARLNGDTRERDEVHPVWHELIAPFTAKSATACTIHARDVLDEKNSDFLFLKPSCQYVVSKFPAFREEWNLPPKKMTTRECESPSSLEMLISCPLRYVLQYIAGIEASSQLDLPEGPLLYGNVAHEVLERYLIDRKKWPDPEKAGKEAGVLFDQYIEDEVTILLLPGRDAERAKLRASVVKAARVLTDILRQGGHEVDGIETEVKKETGIGQVRGFRDLAVRKGADPGILDFKWGGKTRRRKLLEQGKATQLATYSMLSGGYPPTGFFIIQNAELLTVHPDYFPGSTVLKGSDEKEVWENIEKNVTQIREEIKTGRVSVGLPEEVSDGGISMLPAKCEYCEYGLFCRIEEKQS